MKATCMWVKNRFVNLRQQHTLVRVLFKNCIKIFYKRRFERNLLNGTVYHFLVFQNAIEKEYLLNIQEYLMKKNNIK